MLNLDFDYEEKLIDSIKNVTKEQIIETAEKYFSKSSALCILAPKKYLMEADLLKI